MKSNDVKIPDLKIEDVEDAMEWATTIAALPVTSKLDPISAAIVVAVVETCNELVIRILKDNNHD